MSKIYDKNGKELERGDKVLFYAYGGCKHIERIKIIKRNGYCEMDGPMKWWIRPQGMILQT